MSPRHLNKFPHRKRGFCSWCAKPVTPPRQYWCSDTCVDEYRIRADAGYARLKVHARDHGVCALCSLDCNALARAMRATIAEEYWERPGAFISRRGAEEIWDQLRFAVRLGSYPRFQAMAAEHQLPINQWRRLLGARGERDALWDADHVNPVCLGGGECGLDNLRTLCWKCHALVTRELHTKLRALRCAAEILFDEEVGA